MLRSSQTSLTFSIDGEDSLSPSSELTESEDNFGVAQHGSAVDQELGGHITKLYSDSCKARLARKLPAVKRKSGSRGALCHRAGVFVWLRTSPDTVI